MLLDPSGPVLTSFAHSIPRAVQLLQQGVKRILIDHPSVGCRTFDESTDPILQRYQSLTSLDSSVEWVANIDILPDSSNESRIEQAIQTAHQVGIRHIRVQDVGVIDWVHSVNPDTQVTLAIEMGNHSTSAMAFWSQHVTAQSISNDVPASVIAQLDDKRSLECLVQGPVLMQWSKRLYLDGFTEPRVEGVDAEYPGRKLTFWQSEHGTVMLAYFHRCLLRDLETLRDLGLGSWLIDARGQSDAYLQQALRAYQAPSLDLGEIRQIMGVLQAESGRPQLPGFFRGNSTDQERDGVCPDAIVGHITDSQSGSHLIMRARRRGDVNEPVMALTPTNQIKPLSLMGATSVLGAPLTQFEVGDWVVLPFQKGVVVKTWVIDFATDPGSA